MHSDYGDDSLPIGVFDTLQDARIACESKFPTLIWDIEHEGLSIVKAFGKIETADYLDIIELPENEILDRDLL